MGAPVESTHEQQAIEKVRVYPGGDGEFTLYNDDGSTYAYEHGDSQITHLRWADATGKLTWTGAKPWTGEDASVVQVVGR